MYDTNATIPVSDVRQFVRRIAVDGGLLKNQGGTWRFNGVNQSLFTGLDTTATYQSEDQAIDAILGVYFPSLAKNKAA